MKKYLGGHMKKDLLEQILNNGKNVIVSGNIASGKTTNITSFLFFQDTL